MTNASPTTESAASSRCGAAFDENSVPPWTRGDFRGVCSCGFENLPLVLLLVQEGELLSRTSTTTP